MFFAKAKGKRADLYIYEAIGEGWAGGITAKAFMDAVASLGKPDALDIYINSPGGSVFDGLAIFNILDRFRGEKIVHIDGIAASIASVIAMAGDEIRIAENAMMMIHDPWGMSVGTSADMRKYADALDKTRDSIRGTYVARTKRDAAEVGAMMAAETWMTAAETVAAGFATQAVEAGAPMRAAAGVLARFRNTPAALLAQAPRNGLETRGLLARMDMRISRASPAKT